MNVVGELLNDRQDVLLGEDQQFLFLQLELRAGVLLEEDLLADGNVHRPAGAVLEDGSRADGQDGALLRALLGGVGQDDPALRHLFARGGLHEEPIAEGLELRSRCADRCGHLCVVPPWWHGTRSVLMRELTRDRQLGRSDPCWHSTDESANALSRVAERVSRTAGANPASAASAPRADVRGVTP